CDGSSCRRNGWHYLNCEWRRAVPLGVALGCDRQARGISIRLSRSSRSLLADAARHRFWIVYQRGVCDFALLWRWLRHHARLCHGLLRPNERRFHLWIDAYGLGICRRAWANADCTYSAEQRALLAGA